MRVWILIFASSLLFSLNAYAEKGNNASSEAKSTVNKTKSKAFPGQDWRDKKKIPTQDWRNKNKIPTQDWRNKNKIPTQDWKKK